MFVNVYFERRQNLPDSYFVNFSNNDGGIRANLSNFSSESVDTLREVGEIIGENRLVRILQRDSIHLNREDFKNGRKFLTVEIFRKILLEMSDVRYEDLKEAPGKVPEELKPFPLNDLFKDPFNPNVATVVPIDPIDRAESSGKESKD